MFRHGIEIGKDSDDAHFEFSMFLLKLNQNEESMEMLHKAFELKPSCEKYYNELLERNNNSWENRKKIYQKSI